MLPCRRPLGCPAGQHRARLSGGDGQWSDPSSLLPVPPVCCQRRGEGPVQQGDGAVSSHMTDRMAHSASGSRYGFYYFAHIHQAEILLNVKQSEAKIHQLVVYSESSSLTDPFSQ